MKIFNLNQLWYNIGVTEFSFLFFLKIIFFILFILLNVGLLYSEYKDNKLKENSDYISSGVKDEIKHLLRMFATSAGAYSTYLTINNNANSESKLDEMKREYLIIQEEAKKIRDESLVTKLYNKLNYSRIDSSFNNLSNIKEEKMLLNQRIEEMKARLKTGDKQISETEIVVQETRLLGLIRAEERASAELQQDIARGVNFSNEIIREDNEKKIIERINEDDFKKASIFNLDELISSFESLGGIGKLVCLLMFTSYIILSSIFNIILNIYGNYLLDRFKLEEKYPKLAFIINYRRKVSKYYVISNFLVIIIICIINIMLGLSIISIYI